MFLKIWIFKILYFQKKSAQLFIILVGLTVTLFSKKFHVQLDQKILKVLLGWAIARPPCSLTVRQSFVLRWSRDPHNTISLLRKKKKIGKSKIIKGKLSIAVNDETFLHWVYKYKIVYGNWKKDKVAKS
jgi:hypothetical protein